MLSQIQKICRCHQCFERESVTTPAGKFPSIVFDMLSRQRQNWIQRILLFPPLPVFRKP